MPADGIAPITQGVRTLGAKYGDLLEQLREANEGQNGLKSRVQELEAVVAALKTIVETGVSRTDAVITQVEGLSTSVSEQHSLLETTIARVDVLES
jgi:hypothetical protein